ncbi:TerC family protein [Prochlorococcus sp. MIT 1011]|uniref:TerC family protein n=1 Tax=Prochlorococcus sp. MIT 1011 TaxID=3082520 RepID=UPI0039B4F720
MDSASLRSLTPLLDGIDRWVELAPLLPVLVSLELVLSADNAVALASITKNLNNIDLQRKALNIGIFIALLLRIIVILTAQFFLNFWPVKLIGGIYLISLSISKFISLNSNDTNIESNDNIDKSNISLLKVILLLSVTDLAFSIDSITAAVAISDQFLLVITGAIIGVIALRFTSGLFIKWLEIYINLEKAGYIAVGLIGTKLIIQLILYELVIPEYLFFLVMLCLFLWGFSKKDTLINNV